MFQVLSIGNSFSQDAHHYLFDIAAADDREIYLANLYYGGCSLEQHLSFYQSDTAAYDYEINGVNTGKISLAKALIARRWDAITFQQASPLSGIPESYFPYLTALQAAAKNACGGAKFWLCETWAYEAGAAKAEFSIYHNDQREMYARLSESYRAAARQIGADILPVGTLIQYLRENVPAFDVRAGGISLTRDGYHLSELYGRYAAALVWYGALFGADVSKNSFVPQKREARAELLNTIKAATAAALSRVMLRLAAQ